LGNEVKVGDEGALENDGDIGSVEQLDLVAAGRAADLGVLDLELDTEALKIQ
jgi:hypothetical protein